MNEIDYTEEEKELEDAKRMIQDRTMVIDPDISLRKRAGRPKGKTDTLKRASPFVKAQAKGLYLAGHLSDEIAAALNCKENTVASWASKENWNVERDKILGLTTTQLLNDIIQSQKESFDGLKTIRERAIEAIKGKIKDKDGNELDQINPTRYSEAANAYIAALEVEYKIKSEALQASFINDVAQVLKQKIQDRELLQSIAEGLRAVFERYQKRMLPPERREGEN